MIQISVVIPCYNGYKYMGKCLKSLKNQSYKNFEVIIVDDCSNDNSFEKLKLLENSQEINVRVIKNEKNEGPGVSRKIGVSNATGSWICFCDSDDYYDNDYLKLMYEKVSENDSDCILCDYNKIYDVNRKESTKYIKKIKDIRSTKEILVNAKETLCVILIKKNILERIDFPNLRHGEDAALIPTLITNCKKIELLDKPLYNYVMRENSISNTPDINAYFQSLEVFKIIRKNIKSFDIEVEFIGIKLILYTAMLNGIKAHVENKTLKKDIELFVEEYPSYKGNIYLCELEPLKRLFVYLIANNHFVLANIYAKIHHKYINR